MTDFGGMSGERPHVVIIGGGFAGLYAARALGGAPVRVTLIDRRNHHLFQPLLYQVATAVLSPGDIAAPIRFILRRHSNVHVVLAEVTGFDLDARKVLLADGEVSYDYLVVATGTTHSYFGHPEWEEVAPGLKTVEDALEIRRRVLLAYEAAERETDPERRREWLTFVVVGGGPTGVELAGALAEIARHSLERDFRSIDTTQARVMLLEGAPRILGAYPPELSDKGLKQLEKIGVEVRTEAKVTGIDERGVTLGDQRIAARTVLWGAGVAASPLGRKLGVPLDRAGRVIVRPDLTIPGRDDVFVLGDLPACTDADGKVVPGLAPAAIQQGKHTGANVLRRLQGAAYQPFRYRDKGSMATIGRNAAIAQIGRLKFGGFFAWAAWLFIHILFLIGFRNRLLVMLQWAMSYFTWQRGARLITGEQPARLLDDGTAATPAQKRAG